MTTSSKPILMQHENLNTLNENPLMSVPTSQHHIFFLDHDLIEPKNYRHLITTLFHSDEKDEVTIYINSNGGCVDIALAIIEGLKHTTASTSAVIMGACHSAASMIALNCQKVIVLDSAYFLIHTASFLTLGTTNNVQSHTEFIVKKIENLLHQTYQGFLTPKELEKIKTGTEIWLDAAEARLRLRKKASLNKLPK